MRSLRASLSAKKRKLREFRVRASAGVLTGLALTDMYLRPAERWYWDVRWLSFQVAKLIHVLRPSLIDPSLHARLMHRLIDVLADQGRPFPIPTRVEGMHILEQAAAGESGFVCCAAHVPFVKLFIPIIRKVLRPGAELVATVKYPRRDGKVDVWNDEPVDAIPAGPGVLLQTRSLLRRGGCLVLLADKEQGEYISSNIFRFVGKVQSIVIMGFPHLLADGTILLQIVEAPAPHCRNEVEVRANLDFIAQTVRSILAGDNPPEKIRASVMPLAQVSVAEGGREVDRIQLYSRSQLEARAKRLQHLLADETIQVSDRALYEKRLEMMERELQLRSQLRTRAEFAEDGTPLY